MFLIPALTTLISLVFAVQMFNQYRARGRTHQFAWGLALVFYAVAAFPEVTGSLSQWSVFGFRLYYLFGAVLLVPWLALGSVELLAPAGVRIGYRGFVLAISLLGLVAVTLAPLHAAHLVTTHPPDNCTMWCKSESGYGLANGLAALSAAVGNTIGTVVLVAGALWSAYRTYRAGAHRNLFLGNILIAAGAFVVAAIATLTRLGYYELFYAGQAAGIAIIFGGFLLISTAARRPEPATI